METEQLRADLATCQQVVYSKPFLGREYLTWLWFIAETKSDLFIQINKSKVSVSVWIDDKVVLQSSAGSAHIQSLKGGNPSKSPEATSALLSGKFVKEMKLGLDIDSVGEFGLTLSADDITPKSIALPSNGQSSHTIEERLQLIEILMSTLDQVYSQFLDERIQEDWQSEQLKDISKWINSRRQLSEQLAH